MLNNLWSFFSLFLLGIICSQSSWAQNRLAADPMSLSGAHSTSLSGSGVARNQGPDSLFQNPGAAAMGDKYQVSLGYSPSGNSLGASIVDLKSGPIGGGVFYSRRDFRGFQAFDETNVFGNFERLEEHAGIAVMGRPRPDLGVGVSARYSYRRSFDSEVPNVAAWNADAGLLYSVNRDFQVGAALRGLMGGNAGIYPRVWDLGVSYSLTGTGFSFLGRAFRVDPTSISESPLQVPNQIPAWGLGAGAEYAIQDFRIRGGIQNNPAWFEKTFSLGAAYMTGGFALEYAFSREISDSHFQRHLFTATGYF